MKKQLRKIHNQILIALVLGAIFGAYFNVNKNLLIISYKGAAGIEKSTVKNWDELVIVIPGKEKTDSVKFISSAQLEVIAFAQKLKKEQSAFGIIVKNFEAGGNSEKITEKEFPEIKSIQKEKTIAGNIKWIGDIFIRLLNMIAIPLVLSSLIVGAASLGDIKTFARIGSKTMVYYLSTTAIAVALGITLANVIQPGTYMNPDTKFRLLSSYKEDIASKIDTGFNYDFFNELVNIVPKNPISAMANAEMLQIVFFAVLFGLVLTMVDKEKSKYLINFFDSLSDTMIKMVDLVMKMAPFGVFALIAATVSEFGFDILQTLFWYAATVLLGLLLHTFGIYSIFLKIFSRVKLGTFFVGMRKAQTIAFSTSSSAATLPVNFECCQDNLGVSKSITSFVLPLGATINMDGTALYQGVAAVFIAQVYGIDLSLMQQLIIILTATLASIGTAPVPGVGIIMLIIVLKSVGIPEEGIALIIGVDRILDMCRTVTNITGDAAGAVIVATSENEILVPAVQAD